jgi:two-component system sensor histidine kinase HydH
MAQRQQLSKRFLTLSMALLVLVCILGFYSYRQITRERTRYLTMLTLKGNTLIASLVAGTRVGMIGMFWSKAQLQALLAEFVRDPDVQSLIIWNQEGERIAEAGSLPRSAFPLAGVEQALTQGMTTTSMLSAANGQELFTLTTPFLPAAIDQTSGRSLQYLQHMLGMMQQRLPETHELFVPENLAVTVGLRTTTMHTALREEIWKTIVATVICLLGSGIALYFALGIERAQTIRRTLREMRLYTQHVIDSMPNGLISVDVHGKIQTVNPLASQLLGILTSSLPGRFFAEVFPESVIALEDTLRTGKAIIEQEVDWLTTEGQHIPFSVSATPLRAENGIIQGAVVMLRDLRDLRAMQEQVKRVERLAALGRLAAGVAHEIRNPLGAIKGLAQYFQRKWKDQPEERAYAEVIVREVDRLNRVVTDLLELARVRPPRYELLDPITLAEHAVALVTPDLQIKGARIQLLGSAAPFYADRDQMTQVLLNLLLNAIDAVTTGDEITILLADRSGEEVEIRIQDTGCGIAPTDLPQIFDPFFTTKKKGAGLGLAIAHQIVVNHQGTIQVESMPGQGTIIILRLPVQPASDISTEGRVK